MAASSRPTTEGADDGRRGRRRTATASGAFAGRPAALVDDLTLPSVPRWSTAAGRCWSSPVPGRARPGCSRGASPTCSPPVTRRPGRSWPSPSPTRRPTRCASASPSWSGRGPSRCGSRPSTRPACASCAPTPTGSATARRSPSTTTRTRAGMIEMITSELGFDTKRLPARAVRGVISQAKSELVDFEAFRDEARHGRRPFRTAHRRRLRRSTSSGCWRPTPWTSTTCC